VVDDKEKPAVTLLRPTGGEVLPGGTVFRIEWVSDDNVGVAGHELAFSGDGGKTFATTIAAGISGNQQSYDWVLPAGIAPSRNAAVRITATDAAGNAQSATIDGLTVIGSGFTPNSIGTYTYDALNRLVFGALSEGRSITWVWDEAGNLTQISVQ
jgi:YD repeat-containing protein